MKELNHGSESVREAPLYKEDEESGLPSKAADLKENE
jgi:hypothetical protein